MTDDARELSVSRFLDAPRAAVWRAYTDHLAEWWCPRPWTAEVVANKLRAGGRLLIMMRGPAGEEQAVEGINLEVVPATRVVFTDSLATGWIPQGPFMVGIFEFADEGTGTRYTGRARHWTEQACEQHRAMGFADGWGRVADQLEQVARRLAGLD